MLQGPSLKRHLALVVKSSQPTVSTKSLPSSSLHTLSFSSSLINVCSSCSSFFDSNVKEKLRHYRLIHMPMNNMKHVFQFSKSCSKLSSPCGICPMTRQSKLSFLSSSICTKASFDLIHVDIQGPYKSTTHDRYRYFLTIVDDFCRATWTYLLGTKSNSFSVLQFFLFIWQKDNSIPKLKS